MVLFYTVWSWRNSNLFKGPLPMREVINIWEKEVEEFVAIQKPKPPKEMQDSQADCTLFSRLSFDKCQSSGKGGEK